MPTHALAPVQWRSVSALRSPDDECSAARRAFALVAPEGVLPAQPTPLQRLLHTRMVTSAFIAAMAGQVARQKALPTVVGGVAE